MASNSGVAILQIFCWARARKNACWGASPNPALWDKMSQRDWLRNHRCRGGSFLVSCMSRYEKTAGRMPTVLNNIDVFEKLEIIYVPQ